MPSRSDVIRYAVDNGIPRTNAERLLARCPSPEVALMRLRHRVRQDADRATRRADERWLEDEAERRAIIHRATREVSAAERRRRREARRLGARLDTALADLGRAAVAPAGALGARRGQPDSMPPPPADTPQVEQALTMIRWHVELVEAVLDELQGLETPTHLTPDQKDHLIVFRFQGVPSADLARDVPELGSQRTVERVRAAANQRPSNGAWRPELHTAE